MKTRKISPSLALSLALAGIAPSANVQAQAYPERPVRMVVPFPPGGNTDFVGRLMASKLTSSMGQSVLIDNRPGANTIIGAEVVARSNPDGYTLMFAGITTLAVNPAVYKKLPYNVARDFAPVAKVCENAFVVSVRAGFAPKTVQELMSYAKANPGKVTYASTGEGSPAHFGGVMLEMLGGISLTHVPYKGNTPVINDMLGERVDINITGLPSIQGLVDAKKIRLLAYAGSKRSAAFPDLPTVAESGMTGYWSGSWFSVITKSGTPRPVIMKLNQEVNRALQDDDTRKQLAASDYEITGGTPEDLAKLIASETPRWAKLAQLGKISYD